MRFLAAAAVLAAAAALLSSCASAPQAGGQFAAQLAAASGATSSATGQATFQLSPDGKSLSYVLTISNLANVTMAHIHVSAAPGQTGDVAAWLYPSKAPPMLKEGTFSGVLARGTLTDASLQGPLAGKTLDDLVDDIAKGLAYVNVHTSQYPGGEISGTITAEKTAGATPGMHMSAMGHGSY